jgi:hypothetical protein
VKAASCYQPYTSESSQEFNDDGTNPRRKMTNFCWWVAFPPQIGNLDSLPQAKYSRYVKI